MPRGPLLSCRHLSLHRHLYPPRHISRIPATWIGENSSPFQSSAIEREVKPEAKLAPLKTRWKLIQSRYFLPNQLQTWGPILRPWKPPTFMPLVIRDPAVCNLGLSYSDSSNLSLPCNIDRNVGPGLIRSVFGKGKRNRANSMGDTTDPRPASKSKPNFKSLASSAAKLTLLGIRESTDAFPPLKSAASALCFILEHCEVLPTSGTHYLTRNADDIPRKRWHAAER